MLIKVLRVDEDGIRHFEEREVDEFYFQTDQDTTVTLDDMAAAIVEGVNAV